MPTKKDATKEMNMRLNDMKSPFVRVLSDNDDTTKDQKVAMVEIINKLVECCELWQSVMGGDWNRADAIISEYKDMQKQIRVFTMTKAQIKELNKAEMQKEMDAIKAKYKGLV